MAITTKSFTQLVRDQAAAVQGRASGLVDFTVGAIMRAFAESIAQAAMWLQGLILGLLQTTRLSTCSGSAVDSFVADYGLTRLQPQTATGAVTFSRFSTVGQAVVPVGSTVETADGSQQYVVTTDTTNAAYNASLGGYVMAAGVASVTVQVQASVAGSAANAVAGAISTITAAIPGVDTVTNALAFTNGLDQETDAALKSRFQAYIQSLSKATLAAVVYAIQSVRQNVTETVTENFTYAGTAQDGHFSIVANDGSGNPPGSFLSNVYAAVDLVRPITTSFEVHGPTPVTATISLTISVASGYVASTVAGQVQSAITAYIASLQLGQALAYTRLAQVAYDASAGVTNVTSVVLNGGTSDLAATAIQVIAAGTITVSHT